MATNCFHISVDAIFAQELYNEHVKSCQAAQKAAEEDFYNLDENLEDVENDNGQGSSKKMKKSPGIFS